jgi:hypothetical protein
MWDRRKRKKKQWIRERIICALDSIENTLMVFLARTTKRTKGSCMAHDPRANPDQVNYADLTKSDNF